MVLEDLNQLSSIFAQNINSFLIHVYWGLTIYIMALAANSLIFLARILSPLKPLVSRSNLIGSKVTFRFLKDEFQANG